MFGISYEEILKRISEEKNVSIDELQAKVKEKLNKLSDLISKEGAAHIVANEYGVKLIEDAAKKTIPISRILIGMRHVNLLGKVMKTYGVREFKTSKREGKVASFLVADQSEAVRIVMWDVNHIKHMEEGALKEGTIVKIKNAYVRDNNGFKEVHLGNQSEVILDPPGEDVGEVHERIAAPKAIVKKISELSENDNNIELIGTIVQVYEPRFFQAKDRDGNVQDENAPILNFFFDDGSGNIRTVVFRDVVGDVLNMKNEEIIKFKENPSEFESVKNDLLGKQLKLIGRTKKNDMMNRLEFTANSVAELDVDKIAKEKVEEIIG
jgi:ssDNA-binding replication factor A large subunit